MLKAQIHYEATSATYYYKVLNNDKGIHSL